MTVILYLLPLGLIFDMVGYVPPSARLFLIYLLLALPLALRPCKASGYLALVLLLAAVFRAWLPLPPVAESALLLSLHLMIWSVLAPVPRALHFGVVAFAVLHLGLFVSPLGHPLLEFLTGLGNGVAGSIVGQPFHLGPTYLGLGALLLFLMLSVFSWDGGKVAMLRTAAFLVVALLLNALAAVILIEKTDFTASFAWTLKFRDLFRFPELWTQLKGLGVIVFPGFLFLAQLAVFRALHYGKETPRDGGEAEAAALPGWRAMRGVFRPGRRGWVLVALGVLALLAAVPPTSWRNPAACDLVFVERGVVSFTKPDYTRYGESAGGMFGMLPEYARLFGCKSEVVKDIPEQLDPGKVLVLTNLDEDLEAEALERIWKFVDEGGRLWVLGDHTFIKNGKNHLNEILKPCHISFNNDSAQFFPQGWFHSYRFPQGTPFSTLRDDAENRPGILVGASLELGVPAQPLVMGRFGYSDWGTNEPDGNRGHLGDFKYQPSERLGDLVLVAGERHGDGRVLVYGDTSSFFNNNLARSFELLRASLGWLGESNGWSFPASLIGRGIAALCVLGFVVLAFVWRAAAVGAAPPLLAVMGFSMISHGRGGLPDYEPEFAREHLAVIDFSHQPNASKHSAMDDGLHGVGINLMRHGMLPVAMNDWDRATLDQARILVMNAPRRPVGGRERRDMMRFMERGGTVILGCGYLDAAACAEWLESLGCRIGDVPLGRFFDRPALGQPVSFMSAWIIDEVPKNATVLCASADWPLMISVPVGGGEMILIGDSEFLHNRNLEGHKNHDPANTAFLKNLLDSVTR